MLAVKGFFDGENIKLLEKVDFKEPTEVIITFLDLNSDEPIEIVKLAELGNSFDFLNDEEENIYSDKDLDVKYSRD